MIYFFVIGATFALLLPVVFFDFLPAYFVYLAVVPFFLEAVDFRLVEVCLRAAAVEVVFLAFIFRAGILAGAGNLALSVATALSSRVI
jgi:hypothetical protein